MAEWFEYILPSLFFGIVCFLSGYMFGRDRAVKFMKKVFIKKIKQTDDHWKGILAERKKNNKRNKGDT